MCLHISKFWMCQTTLTPLKPLKPSTTVKVFKGLSDPKANLLNGPCWFLLRTYILVVHIRTKLLRFCGSEALAHTCPVTNALTVVP